MGLVEKECVVDRRRGHAREGVGRLEVELRVARDQIRELKLERLERLETSAPRGSRQRRLGLLLSFPEFSLTGKKFPGKQRMCHIAGACWTLVSCDTNTFL